MYIFLKKNCTCENFKREEGTWAAAEGLVNGYAIVRMRVSHGQIVVRVFDRTDDDDVYESLTETERLREVNRKGGRWRV